MSAPGDDTLLVNLADGAGGGGGFSGGGRGGDTGGTDGGAGGGGGFNDYPVHAALLSSQQYAPTAHMSFPNDVDVEHFPAALRPGSPTALGLRPGSGAGLGLRPGSGTGLGAGARIRPGSGSGAGAGLGARIRPGSGPKKHVNRSYSPPTTGDQPPPSH